MKAKTTYDTMIEQSLAVHHPGGIDQFSLHHPNHRVATHLFHIMQLRRKPTHSLTQIICLLTCMAPKGLIRKLLIHTTR
jgi:hypothetical protein